MFERTILAIHTCDFRFHTCDLHAWSHHTCDFTDCTYVLAILIQTILAIYMFGHIILAILDYILAITNSYLRIY